MDASLEEGILLKLVKLSGTFDRCLSLLNFTC